LALGKHHCGLSFQTSIGNKEEFLSYRVFADCGIWDAESFEKLSQKGGKELYQSTTMTFLHALPKIIPEKLNPTYDSAHSTSRNKMTYEFYPDLLLLPSESCPRCAS